MTEEERVAALVNDFTKEELAKFLSRERTQSYALQARIDAMKEKAESYRQSPKYAEVRMNRETFNYILDDIKNAGVEK